jgi:hypothetical protein
MKELLRYVEEENRWIEQSIQMQFKRKPLSGELMDLSTANGRAKIREHLEISLEDDVLHQDGERPLREANADYRRLTKIVDQLDKYQHIEGPKNGRKSK